MSYQPVQVLLAHLANLGPGGQKDHVATLETPGLQVNLFCLGEHNTTIKTSMDLYNVACITEKNTEYIQ